MHLTCQYVICLSAAVVSGQYLGAVSLTLSYEGSKDFLIDFQFSFELFQSFYQCLCKAETQLCSLPYDASSNVIKGVQLNSTRPPALSQCKIYVCTNSAQATKVICRTVWEPQACATGVSRTYFSLDLPSSCSASCIGIAWNLAEEKLTVRDPQLQVKQCGKQCCSGVASVQPPPQTESSGEQIYKSNHVASYTDTYIVGGIAAGVVFIAIVVFVMFLVLKRRTGSSTGLREATNATQSSTNGIHHSLYPNNTVINGNQAGGGDAGRDEGKKHQSANLFAGLGLANARQKPGHEHKNKESDDIVNKPAHNKTDNKSKASGNGLFRRKSNKSAGCNDEISNDSADDHTNEGDYAEIDELQIQDSNNLVHTQDSTETEPNDGYSSVDNSDYYNINGNTLGTAGDNIGVSREGSRDFYTPKEDSSIMESNTGVKTAHQKYSNISVQQPHFSEYSVAQGISEEAPTYSMGQQMDRQSTDPKFRSEQEQGNTSDGDDDDRRPNSYFILEKDSEEADI
ncbi:hypothetical protein BsWGS_09341 [Bradybaena similaris]